MPNCLKMPILWLILQLAAFWPVWRWVVSRAADSSDDHLGWIALVTVLCLAVYRAPGRETVRGPLWLPAGLTLGYALSYHFLPPLPRAMIAICALASTLSLCRFGTPLQGGICGLLLLSLPLMASLQFYLGYPLRALIAMAAGPLLQLGGLPVFAEGTGLNWNGRLVMVDAPCSGIKMLWAGLYLTFTLSGYYRLNLRRTLAATAIASIVVILGNLFRSVGLFYVESGILQFPAWTHEGIGVAAFLLTAAAIAGAMRHLTSIELCVELRFF
ncbi:MAG TPA: archaeosortase/exosortase family protein [Blastocatellia bacterium]|nr:archaeosortase/exosortase family protein [Blastocatellia bacterium]